MKLGKKLFLLCVMICLLLSVASCGTYKSEVTTEYGDKFTITCDDRGKWFIEDGSYFRMRCSYGYEEGDLYGVCDEQDFRCYCLKGILFYESKDTVNFKRIERDFKGSEDQVDFVKSKLLSDPEIFKLYDDYYYKNYKSEMEQLIEDLYNKKYDNLTQYGMSDEISSDPEKMERFLSYAHIY